MIYIVNGGPKTIALDFLISSDSFGLLLVDSYVHLCLLAQLIINS